MTWSDEHRNGIVKRIQERGVNRPCQRCGSESFSLIDGYAVFGLVDDLQDEGIRHLMPSVCVACSRCGFLTFHALGALGLLPKDQPLPPGQNEVVE
jgi:ribosomal protein L37E